MRKNHPSSGRGIAWRMLVYSLTFSALIGVRENLTGHGGPISDAAGAAINGMLKASSKLGLGIAQMSEDPPGDVTLIGQGGRMLGKASHEAFVSASKVEIYGR
jgi:hypothetical protein